MTSQSFSIGLLLLLLVFLFSLLAEAGVGSYVEDFGDITYKDAAHTTALWDTVDSLLTLRPFEQALVGSLDAVDNAGIVAISGDYAFVTDGYYGLRVIDISDPTNPSLTQTADTPGNALQDGQDSNSSTLHIDWLLR